MQTYLVERAVPPAFTHDDPATLPLHARWATDAYHKVGAFWLGGVITDDGMFSLVAAEQPADLFEYGRSLGFPEGEVVVRRVIRPIGPSSSQPRG